MKFIQQAYQGEKPFSNFLSGIAGEKGIPLWVFYVNRGQLISGFGIRDKNGAMMEFFPADQAYSQVTQVGFRTYLKIDNTVFECFQECNKMHQTLIEEPHQVTIQESIEALQISIEITYFTLPQEKVGGLVRKVTIRNYGHVSRKITILDGLLKLLPANLDSGLLKNMSNTLRSWIRTNTVNDAVFYSLSASLGDTSQVDLVRDVNTYQTFGLQNKTYITDLRSIFKNDTTYHTPYELFEETTTFKQAHVNQVPAAMTLTSCEISQELSFHSLFSYSSSAEKYIHQTSHIDQDYFELKRIENEKLHHVLMSAIETNTALPIFNDYLKKTYLDNVLRGGTPKMFETRQGLVPYYIYSRKHGDLERDYNFFSIEPNYLSQGNGNFRDVLQNRRNDLLFEPKIKAYNIFQFLSFIQADGYNPLNIQGIKFHYVGENFTDEKLNTWLKQPFSPGHLLMYLTELNKEDLLDDILKQSNMEYIAHFHEGYWEDHFTYIHDLIELYKNIYPDEMKFMLFEYSIAYYQSPVAVLPRSQKNVQTKEGSIRQYGSIKHLKQDQHWLIDSHHQLLKTNVFGKILIIVLTKFGHLDSDSIGLMYEADKPGWNDAMNGLPGLFGSGVSEMFELAKLVQFLQAQIKAYPDESVCIFTSLHTMLRAFEDNQVARNYEKRITILETYRADLLQTHTQMNIRVGDCQKAIHQIQEVLQAAIEKAKNLQPVVPTYLTYEVQSYKPIDKDQPHTTHYGLPAVKIESFKRENLPIFLEGPARYLKTVATKDEAYEMYNKIKKSPLYDSKLKMYKTSESLDHLTHEIGRIKAFTPGWLERESIFLHMTYKYLLGLLVAGAYDAYFEALSTNLVCFLDPKTYGRSNLENSSFLASSNNPDETTHGQGFIARLSGSTAELLSMWRIMFLGKELFTHEDELTFQLTPKLTYSWFQNDKIQTTLFKTTQITYVNLAKKDTFAEGMQIVSYELRKSNKTVDIIYGNQVKGALAEQIRNQNLDEIIAHLDIPRT